MPSTHPRRLHPLLLLHIPLLIHICTPHPLTPLLTLLPHLTNQSLPAPPSLSAGRDLECFAPGTPKAHPVNLADCPLSIELLYHDPTGVMTLQTFVREPGPPYLLHPPPTNNNTTNNPPLTQPPQTTAPTTPNNPPFPVPFAWQHGGCQILLTTGSPTATDTFRLADVIHKASRIIEQCPPLSKRNLGGLALVGNGQTFFVAVNGPDLDPGGVEGEEEVGVGEGEQGEGVGDG